MRTMQDNLSPRWVPLVRRYFSHVAAHMCVFGNNSTFTMRVVNIERFIWRFETKLFTYCAYTIPQVKTLG